jgi:hypothetical protein
MLEFGLVFVEDKSFQSSYALIYLYDRLYVKVLLNGLQSLYNLPIVLYQISYSSI